MWIYHILTGGVLIKLIQQMSGLRFGFECTVMNSVISRRKKLSAARQYTTYLQNPIDCNPMTGAIDCLETDIQQGKRQ